MGPRSVPVSSSCHDAPPSHVLIRLSGLTPTLQFTRQLEQEYLNGDVITLPDLFCVGYGALPPAARSYFLESKLNVDCWFKGVSGRASWRQSAIK